MSYITREDGEHFVIPSYRDVLSAKQKNALKKEILVLSQSYGEFIALQKKGTAQYEVAFSPDPGYLLGESIWQYFKRPLDMIYCEAVPNTTEAILVIVKAGSVYLDGSFPIESIPEELVIFLTQQNNFEVYTYGEVPISETPVEGKFAFEASSIKNFTVLNEPVFAKVPLLKTYQLRNVEIVLKEYGIGVFPLRQILLAAILLGLLWMGYSYFVRPKKVVVVAAPKPNPYAEYYTTLTSPSPDDEIEGIIKEIKILLTMPGWSPRNITYSKGTVVASVQSAGAKTQALLDWADLTKATVDIKSDGIYVSLRMETPKRPNPNKIYPIKEVIAILVDKLSNVYPGNHLTLGAFSRKGVYTQVPLTLNISNVPPAVLELIAKQLKDLPLALEGATLSLNNGYLNGTFIIDALGS